MAALDGDDEFFDQFFKQDYDDFFAADTPVPSASVFAKTAQSAAGGDSSDIEAQYASLSQHPENKGLVPKVESARTKKQDCDPATTTFALDSDSDDGAGLDVDTVPTIDCLPPELPEPPADFTREDLQLREVLIDFYLRYRADNLLNIDVIVKQYRGRAVTHLWANLAIKYKLEAADVIELVARTLYISAPFECTNEGRAKQLEEQLEKFQTMFAGGVDVPEDRQALLRKSIESGTVEISDDIARILCFRGIPVASELRPQLWKVMLGYLPLDQRSDWKAIQAGKHALYKNYKDKFLVVTSNNKFEVKVEGHRIAEAVELLQQIQRDVDRTQQDIECFQSVTCRSALIALLFVYAQLNPSVSYVQGMNEIAAIILYVMSEDPEFAEADAFWCFTELMTEIKAGFMQALDNSNEGIHAVVGSVDRLLRTYAPELAKHLQKCGSPQTVFAFRWCTLLFAQDADISEVLRLWDSFLADPRRFELVIHVCVALILGYRDELLCATDQIASAEVLRKALRHCDFEALIMRSWAICALERREPTPVFPVKSALQIVDDLSEWAHGAAARAQEVKAEVARNIQKNIAPVVKHKAGQASDVAAAVAGQASGVAAAVAQDKAQVVQAWLQETAPVRREALEKAQTKFTSLWETVRSTSAAAVLTTQKLAAEYNQTLNAKPDSGVERPPDPDPAAY